MRRSRGAEVNAFLLSSLAPWLLCSLGGALQTSPLGFYQEKTYPCEGGPRGDEMGKSRRRKRLRRWLRFARNDDHREE